MYLQYKYINCTILHKSQRKMTTLFSVSLLHLHHNCVRNIFSYVWLLILAKKQMLCEPYMQTCRYIQSSPLQSGGKDPFLHMPCAPPNPPQSSCIPLHKTPSVNLQQATPTIQTAVAVAQWPQTGIVDNVNKSSSVIFQLPVVT